MSSSYKLDVGNVKKMARGRWLSLLPALSSHAGDLLVKASKRAGKGFVSGPCPICGGVDRFGLLPDANDTGSYYCRHCGGGDGFALLSGINGCSFYQSLQAVADYLNHGSSHNHYPTQPSGSELTGMTAGELAGRASAIKQIIERCQPAPAQAHADYLKNRGLVAAIDIRSPSLLYHRGIPYYVNGKPLADCRGKWLTWPAIIGRVSDSRGWIGIQKIYLTKNGHKATDEMKQVIAVSGGDADKVNCKSMLKATDSLNGGAVRIGKATDKLAVCEGLETGLAVHLMTSLPVACTGTAALLKAVDIPPQVKELFIYADNDVNGAGLKAAEALQERVKGSGVYVRICLPSDALKTEFKGVDWLDAYGQISNAQWPCDIVAAPINRKAQQ